jgi:hydroxymethylpyrimidine pyrophosphatase-like HAD family hydrolase
LHVVLAFAVAVGDDFGASMSRPCERLLALDLDGTLLKDDGTIDPRDDAAIRRARAAGCAVTLATGRVTASTLHVARALGLDVPLVCADGRILAHPQSGASVELYACPRRREALAILRELGLAPLQITPHEIVHEASALEHLGHVTSVWEKVECAVIDDVPGEHAVMLLGIGEPIAVYRAREVLSERFTDTVDVSAYPLGAGPHAVRLRAPGHDKRTGLERIARLLAVPRERVAAVGDWFNDVGMLEWAGRSFAMGGAPEAVRTVASDVLAVKMGQGGGVAEAISCWLAD